MIYASAKYKSKVHDLFQPTDLNVNKLWLLQEGHCMRSQVLNLCDLKKQKKHASTVEYEAGSIETLMRMVELNQGITIVPELILKSLDDKQLENIRHFAAPEPGREIVIVTNRHYIKDRMIKVLKEEIVKSLPDEMKEAIA
jgi:LysR family hydrogen peroxide-inducible transcriptional activator